MRPGVKYTPKPGQTVSTFKIFQLTIDEGDTLKSYIYQVSMFALESR